MQIQIQILLGIIFFFYLCHFFLSFFQLLIMCDLLKYSSILCLAEVSWNLVGNFVWNIAAAHKTALIYSEIRSYIRILHWGYHWEPHFFWVNSWTMSNTDIVESSLKSNSETWEYLFTLRLDLRQISLGENSLYRGTGVSFYIRHPNTPRPCTSLVMVGLSRGWPDLPVISTCQNREMDSMCPFLVFTES